MSRLTKSLLKKYKTLIASIFSFIIGCTITINLAPIDRTCKLENVDREYNIMNNARLKSPDLIVLILSAPKNLDRRNAIRETWLKLGDEIPSGSTEELGKFKMKHYFVIGSLGLSVDDVLHLSTEQSLYNDILILPIHDGYANLTHKVLKSFAYLHDQMDYGLDFKYVLKCDDDSFVLLDNLAKELGHLEIIYLKSDLKSMDLSGDQTPYYQVDIQENGSKGNLSLYWGYFRGNARIKKAGKWEEKSWISCDYYLPYAHGGGYLLSKELVLYLARNSEVLR